MSLKFTNKQLTPFLILFMLLLGNLGFFSNVGAQSAGDILINAVPENPAPGEKVELSLNSYALSLDTSKIDWVINGKTFLSGIGKKSYSITAPSAGGETNVTIRVYIGTSVLENTMIIKPSVTVLLWQAEDSYVPPFYKGKALATPDTKIRVVAMPEIKTSAGYLNPKTMTYAWRKDFSNDQDASGYAKNYFEYISDYLDASNYIEVEATTTDQKYSSASALDLATFKPKLVFYKKTSDLGTVFEKSIENGYVVKDATVLFAAPYFIAPKNIFSSRLIWSWSINGEQLTEKVYPQNILPLQVTPGVTGRSSVKLGIDSMDRVFQTAEKEINLEF